MRLAIIVPTIREEQIIKFKKVWAEQFFKHNVTLFVVHDGDQPWIEENVFTDAKLLMRSKAPSLSDLMGEYNDVISNYTSAVRNAGNAYAYSLGFDYFLNLDDDLEPIGDTIGDHLKALEMKVPISWMAVGTEYTRGFPYGVREEAEVVLSHGVWEGIHDYSATTQLERGNPSMDFYKMPIPKGVYFPLSGMNVAFKRKALSYMYWAPKAEGLSRYDDIYMGILAKREFDKKGWAMVTGYARANHLKLSNVFKNLLGEYRGLRLNETFYLGDEEDPYFKDYRWKFKRWQKFIKSL